jgi:branched-chain amino acid transport system substrate-binding protein
MREMRRRRSCLQALALAGVFASAVFSSACGSSGDSGGASSSGTTSLSAAPASDKPIVVGAVTAESGFLSTYDAPSLKAFRMAIDDLNAHGGVLGRQIKLVEADMKSDPSLGRDAAKSVLAQKPALMLVSTDYDWASPAAQAASQAGVPVFSGAASTVQFGVQGIGPYAYSAGAADLNDGYIMADYAIKKGWKTADVLLDDSSTFTKGECNGFKKRYAELGGKIGEDLTFKQADTQIPAQVSALRSSPSSALVVCSFPPGGSSALKQIRAAGIDKPIVGFQGFDGTSWIKGVPDLTNFYFSAPSGLASGDDPRPEVQKFFDRYAKKYGPSPDSFVLGAYSIPQIWAEAVKQANSIDGEKVKEKLDGFKDFPTLAGPVTYTPEEHITMARPMVIQEYVGGKPHVVELAKPTATPPYALR